MGLSAFSQTADRIQVVDYSPAFLFSGHYMVIRRPPATDSFFIIYPFSLFTWLGLAAMIIGVCVCVLLNVWVCIYVRVRV